jgi:hypothetical protein
MRQERTGMFDRDWRAYKRALRLGVITAVSVVAMLGFAAGESVASPLSVGDDGTVDFSFDRSTFTAINVQGDAGDGAIRIDGSGGAFTDDAVTASVAPGVSGVIQPIIDLGADE